MDTSGMTSCTDSLPPLAAIHNRTLPGACHPQNRGTISWGRDGLLAYGCNTLVVLIDPVTVQVLQCLNKHKAIVNKVKWSNNEDHPMELASADMSGHIMIW